MKFYVRTISPLFLLVVLSLCGSQQAFGLCGKRSRKAPAEQRDTTKSSAYDKFFKEEHRIARGLFTLHEMKGRVYFEIPLRLMDRSMLLGTTISATSDNGHGIVGSKPKDPLHFAFTRAGDRIAMRLISERTVSPPLPDHAEIGRALATSNIGAIYQLFKIETFTPDSSAVVVDATNLFVSDDERLSPFDKYSQHTLSGRLKRKESFEKEKSYVTGIKSFSDNVSVSSSLNYRVTISERGLRDVPVTIAATRSILLLDSLPVSPRITDSRIAVFPTGKMLYSPTTQGARPIWYANRWRLEPSDIEAYRRGELVDPVKPIVFYIDRNFPRTWLPYVIEGVNQWSELFEQIGFRNAVQARLFPEDDPEFDPDNLKYSCVRYAPVTIQNAMGPSWTDPRSGEIVSASVYLYHDVIELINNWLFIQTSPADPRVRQKQIPQEIIGDALRYVLSHEIGHCLGFMHNMGASSVIPVDSLRSPSFTRKTGTTPSIMDYARFNYVAQPGDEGVRLIGCEAAGRGVDTPETAATIATGRLGIFHGMKSYFCQDQYGQIAPVYSISAGLDYPGIGPEHAWLHDTGRAEYVPVTDSEAVDAFEYLSRLEGIIPAIESAHAVAYARKLAPTMGKEQILVVTISGRGDKDCVSVARYRGEEISE